MTYLVLIIVGRAHHSRWFVLFGIIISHNKTVLHISPPSTHTYTHSTIHTTQDDVTADQVAEVKGYHAVCEELRKHMHGDHRPLNKVSPTCVLLVLLSNQTGMSGCGSRLLWVTSHNFVTCSTQNSICLSSSCCSVCMGNVTLHHV